MARFARGDAHVELVRDGRVLVEASAFGEARRVLHDDRAALIAYYARIAELLGDGWLRRTRFLDDVVREDEPPLVAAVDDGDPGALAVYTDWLIERGDPRGELAALRAAPLPDLRQIVSLEKTRGVELFGPLAQLPRPWHEQFAFSWSAGWIDEITFGHSGPTLQPAEVMQHALHAPMARFARWVTLDTWYARTLHEGLAACSCVARIRGVRLLEGWTGPALLAALPELEELELLAGDWVDGGHPRVRRLRITVDRDVPSLTGTWPALTRLDVVATSVDAVSAILHANVLDRATLREVVIEAPGLLERHRVRLHDVGARVALTTRIRTT